MMDWEQSGYVKVIIAGEARIVCLLKQFDKHLTRPLPQLQPLKEFRAKNPEIPRLSDYSKPPPSGWFSHWPKLSWEEGRMRSSGINARKMVMWAEKASHPDMGTVLDIAHDVTYGCDLGTRGVNLCPSTSSNAPSAYKYGERVTDSIATGIKKGIMIGPMTKEEIPFSPDLGVKVNGIMANLRENGDVRVILNLSRGSPFCVNEGMSNEDRFEVAMSNTLMWLRSLHKAGRGSYFCKLDWSGAYKQLRTKEADVRQQFFCWGGCWFAELCLIFGGASSGGLFDRLAKVFRHIATELTIMPADQVQQILDDVVGAGTRIEVEAFYYKYREVALDCGVELASEDDPNKAFSARQTGEVFGINYDTVTFSWWLSERKLGVIIDMLLKLDETDQHTLAFLKTIVGKLIHYRPMVPHGKFHIGQLIKVSSVAPGTDLSRVVTVPEWARAEAWYWRSLLPFCARRVPLPNPDFSLPPWVLHAYTDAAGGSSALGHGVGAVMEPSWWCYLPWGIDSPINSNLKFEDGKMFRNKMSAWELLGPLLVLTAGVELVRNRSLVIPVDNRGSVCIYAKGWCTSCLLCSTLALAISEVAASINCRLEVVKIRRCSNALAEAADAISKADFSRLRRLMPGASAGPARVPRALLQWVANPVGDRHLAAKLLKEMGVQRNILGYQGMFYC